jgi:hypothetical protein
MGELHRGVLLQRLVKAMHGRVAATVDYLVIVGPAGDADKIGIGKDAPVAKQPLATLQQGL